MKKNKLITSGLLYTLGSLLIQGLAFITLPIYTRIISPEVYGEYNLYMAWVGIVSLFIGLQTGGSLSSARVTYDKSEYTRYAVSAFTVSNICFLLIFVVALLVRNYLASIFSLSSTVIVILFLQSYTGYVSGFFGQFFIQQQKAMANLILSFLSAVANVICSISLIYLLENDFIARVIGNFIPSLVIAMICIVYLYSRKEPILDRKYIKFIIWVSVPLIFHLLGHQLLNQLDRLMLGKMLSVKEVAFYSFGYNVGLVIQIVLGSINTAWVPWFFEARKNNDPTLKKSISLYLSLGLFLTLGYLTIFPELALILGGKAYQGSIHFIAWIVLSYFFVFLYTFPVNIQFYHANTKMIPIGTLLAAGINFILNYFFIPIFGIYGSAFATALSYICLLLFHHIVAKKLYDYKDVPFKEYARLTILAFAYALVVNYFVESLLIRWSIGLIVFIVYGIIYKQDILLFIEKRKKKSV